ncbi:ribonuclease P/MRP protein subunit POP5 isoform X2 [Chionomys nivalis]|uniref:ribonuclease P/MRP protein subunit POP5 isoform X2 n=1 Tax=Chionomys nivalis TaxID=269649 RepID=UPI0025933C27|nr:ribonuclease P/MRP protein subunit POP5 isoform X2 [Chionomys nivalis]
MVRYKHRYLLCELVSEDARCRLSLDDRVLGGLVRDTIARVHGTFGAAACSVGFAVRYVNAYTGVVLLRCRKEFYRLLWSALPFITHLESKGHRYSCFLNTLHVGGERETIKKSFSISCLLEKEPSEELSDIAGEDTTEAIE